MQDAAVNAIKYPGETFAVRGVTYGVKDDVLYCRLPSGRSLVYHRPRVEKTQTQWGLKDTITFEGWNQNPKNGPMGWIRMETYYGKLVENIVQAVARDILAFALVNLRKAGYNTVMHVHDEVIVEVPKGKGSIEQVEKIMGTMPSWCAEWPIKAVGGWRGFRYRKD